VVTKVFGYYADNNNKIFVVCDPATGEELDKGYIDGIEVGQTNTATSQLVEDESVVKEIQPVNMRLIAPNIYGNIGYSDYSWEQYGQTGNLQYSAYGPATWPGSSGAHLITGDDPDYWLIVAQVSNPNPWPVKAKLTAQIDRWFDSWNSMADNPSISLDKEVSLGANEIKFVLVNRGKPAGYSALADDTYWSGSQKTWTEIRNTATVSENMDSELPERLKANYGYIDFINYAGSPPEPVDLSNGIPKNLEPSNGPLQNLNDAVGPALVDYSASNIEFNGGKTKKVSDEGNQIPVLKYYPVFIEKYKFESTTAQDEGRLVKEIEPGFVVYATSVDRPYFTMNDTLIDYRIEHLKNRSYYWEITVKHHVIIEARNPDNKVGVSFTNLKLAPSNVFTVKNELSNILSSRVGTNVSVFKPNYESSSTDLSLASWSSVNLAPGETKVLYDGDIETKFSIYDTVTVSSGDSESPHIDYFYVNKSDVEYAIGKVISGFTGLSEPAIIGSANIAFIPIDSLTEKVLSLNRAEYTFKDDGETKTREIGLIETENKWLVPVSYFTGGGQPFAIDDRGWGNLLRACTLSTKTNAGDRFWPAMMYNSRSWVLYDRFGA